MSNFSINDKRRVAGTDEEVVVGVPNEVETTTAEQPKMPEIVFENEETYRLAVGGFRNKLVGMINEGVMTETVANKLLEDFMFNTFNQIVKLKLA